MNIEKLITEDHAKKQACKFSEWMSSKGWKQVEPGKWRKLQYSIHTTEELYDKMEETINPK